MAEDSKPPGPALIFHRGGVEAGVISRGSLWRPSLLEPLRKSGRCFVRLPDAVACSACEKFPVGEDLESGDTLNHSQPFACVPRFLLPFGIPSHGSALR